MARTAPLTLIQYPSGTYGFVGSVPQDLAFELCDAEGREIPLQSRQDLVDAACRCGPGIASRIAIREGLSFKGRSWATVDAALAAANSGGHRVTQVAAKA